MEKNLQIIRNYKDANKLMHLGHRCIGVAKDKNRCGYLVFFFAISDRLIKDLENITEITKQGAREWHKIN